MFKKTKSQCVSEPRVYQHVTCTATICTKCLACYVKMFLGNLSRLSLGPETPTPVALLLLSSLPPPFQHVALGPLLLCSSATSPCLSGPLHDPRTSSLRRSPQSPTPICGRVLLPSGCLISALVDVVSFLLSYGLSRFLTVTWP